jgi:predicted porin
MNCMTFRRSPARAPLASLALFTLCAASGAAQAEDGVKLSGYLDVGVYKESKSATQVGNIQRSNVALSGSEDLGGGTSVFFKLSTRFEIDTGSTENGGRPFWHDESTVGIKSALGSLKVGRALDAMYSNDWAFDPWYYFDRVASPAWDLWHYNYPSDAFANGGKAEYGRLENGIYYVSPTVSGFTLSVSGSPEKRATDQRSSTGVSLNYSANGYSAMLAHETNSLNYDDTFVGLKGTFYGVSVMGAYDRSKAGSSVAKATTLGAQYTLDKTTFNLGWGKVDVDGSEAESMYSGMVGYALSKRTTVYLDLARRKFPTEMRTAVGAGISHSF